MNWWRALPALLAHEDVVLVTVARTQGSVPREAGASMLVTLETTVDTIGGGHLEWEAMAQARAMLLQPSAEPAMQRLSLGASLGQCCGGVVWLVFERIARSACAEWLARVQQLESGEAFQRLLAAADLQSTWRRVDKRSASTREGTEDGGCAIAYPPCETGQAAAWSFTHTITPNTLFITVFGAGHVGAAIVRLLATLDTQIRWVNPRDDQFGATPANVECIASDAPEEAVVSAPAGSFFLVLTHSHALDLTLSEAILRRTAERNDVAWFGLIGSRTKRARFEHRLHALGLDTTHMQCPIGIPGISDKTPEAIAIAVVAQVLQTKETLIHRGATSTC
ncbi:MAG: xanthine dehydrogenase accessory protein XdhC [Rhodocyclaceae bacterium]